MSSSIDQRIVEMQFDNAQFEKGISTSLKSIDNLEKGLKLDGASKGLESVARAADSMDFSGLQGGIYAVQQKFSALEVIGITALQRITNAAISTGESLVKSLSIDQVSEGFTKYEQKTSSIQTLVNATGKSVEEINEYLNKLMWYSDETSYGFTDMTSALATMTSSGGDIDKLIPMIEGVANATAFAGKGAAEFSRIMQFSINQAYSLGYMQVQDWKSLETATVNSKQLQESLIAAGEALGKIEKGSVTLETFRSSLADKWLDKEVMEEGFGQFSKVTEEIYKGVQEGIYENYADGLAKIGDKFGEVALRAAASSQEAKSFTEAVDATKDAVSSSWMETFEQIFGNYEEAKVLWTDLANSMIDVFAGGAEARNEMLKEWKESGGRDDLIQSFWNIWDAVAKVTGSIKEAFGEIFAPITSGKLLSMTENLKNFTASLVVSDETADKLKRTFKGVFAVFDIFKKVLGTVGDAIAKLLGSDGLKDLGNTLLDAAASLGDFLVSLSESFSTDGITGMFDTIVSGISNLFSGVLDSAGGFSGALGTVGSSISSVLGFIWNSFKTVFSWLKENISLKGILGTVAAAFSALTGKKLFDAASGISDFIEKLTGAGKNSGSPKAKISELFESLHDSLQALTTSIKVTSLVGIAGAIGVLTASLNTLSQIDAGSALKGISAMAAMFKMLTKSLDSITKTLSKNGSKGLMKASFSLILIAESMKVLADAMAKFGGLSLKEIAKGLIGVGGGLTIFCVGLKALNGVKIPLRTSISLLAIAESCKILGDAMSKFSGFSWDEIGRSLTAMGGALGELVVALGILNKVSGLGSLAGSVSTLIIVQSLSGLADGLSKFGSFSWDEIEHGLVGMGGALAEVSTAIVAVSKLAGFSSLFAAGSITIVISGLDELADALTKFGFMSWESITHGLVAMGGALAEVAGFTGALGTMAGFSSLLGAGSIRLTITGLSDLADALEQIGGLSWDEIKRGLTGMGGALLEVSAITGAHGLISGFSGLLGSGSLLLAIQGLNDLAEAFKTFSTMSWEDVNNALTAMLGAMGATALGGLANTFSGLGAASIKAVADGLGPLAEAVKQWKGVSVDDKLPGQLSSLATGVSSFWAAGWGADAINTVSSGLGVLAESVKDWAGIEIPEGFADKLQKIATAVSTFSFSGVGAGAISTVAEPLGELAKSMEQWNDILVDDTIGTKLTSISTGVNSFWASGLGADSIADLAAPLGELALSVRKWNNVELKESFETQLSDIAKGVEAFSFCFLAGFSLNELVTPLGDLAMSVRKWNNVAIKDNMQTSLEGLAKGVKSFDFAFLAGWSLDTIVKPLSDLADSVKKWNLVAIPDDVSTRLENLATGLEKFSGVGNISLAVSSIGTISESAVKLSDVDFSSISSGLGTLTDALTKLGNVDLSTATNMGDITTAVSSMMQTFSTAIQNSAPTISESFGSVLTTVINNSATYQNLFYTNGQSLMTKIVEGFDSGNGTLSVSVVNVLTAGAAAIYDQYQNWYTAGGFLDLGLAAGIRAGESNVITAATDVATKALKAAKDALQINSPSKVTYGFGRFFDLGLSNGIYDYADQVAKATETISNQALSAAQIIAENIAATMDEDFEYQPTIRPVLDMDEVDSGIDSFNRSFANRSMNLAGSINRVRKAAPADKYAEEVNPSQNQNGGSNTYNFNQYNYSPKALSRIDLYRQTNNQFAMMKERGKA